MDLTLTDCLSFSTKEPSLESRDWGCFWAMLRKAAEWIVHVRGFISSKISAMVDSKAHHRDWFLQARHIVSIVGLEVRSWYPCTVVVRSFNMAMVRAWRKNSEIWNTYLDKPEIHFVARIGAWYGSGWFLSATGSRCGVKMAQKSSRSENTESINCGSDLERHYCHSIDK